MVAHLSNRVEAFAARVERLRSPSAVLDGLHDVVHPHGLTPLGIWDLPRVFYRPEWPWQADKTLFAYRGTPNEFFDEFREAFAHHGYSFMTHKARQSSTPFTFAEAEKEAKAAHSRKQWVFPFMRNKGFHDGLYCTFRGWTCMFVSSQLLALSRGDRVLLTVAALSAVSRIEDIVKMPRKGAQKSRLLTARERDVLQQLVIVGDTAGAAKALGISVNSINAHLTSARRKLKVRSTLQAALTAYKFRLIEF